MNINTLKLGVIALTVSTLFGCSTIQSASQSVGNKIGITDKTKASAVGGSIIGCGLGGVVGVITNVGIARGCAIGGVALGATAGITAYQLQLDEAKKIQAELAAQNSELKLSIVEKDVQIASKDSELKEGKASKALDKVVIDVPKKTTKANKANFKQAFDMTSRVANKTAKKATIKVYGTKQDIDELKAQVQKTNTIDVSKVNVEYIVSAKKKIECVEVA